MRSPLLAALLALFTLARPSHAAAPPQLAPAPVTESHPCAALALLVEDPANVAVTAGRRCTERAPWDRLRDALSPACRAAAARPEGAAFAAWLRAAWRTLRDRVPTDHEDDCTRTRYELASTALCTLAPPGAYDEMRAIMNDIRLPGADCLVALVAIDPQRGARDVNAFADRDTAGLALFSENLLDAAAAGPPAFREALAPTLRLANRRRVIHRDRLHRALCVDHEPGTPELRAACAELGPGQEPIWSAARRAEAEAGEARVARETALRVGGASAFALTLGTLHLSTVYGLGEDPAGRNLATLAGALGGGMLGLGLGLLASHRAYERVWPITTYFFGFLGLLTGAVGGGLGAWFATDGAGGERSLWLTVGGVSAGLAGTALTWIVVEYLLRPHGFWKW